MNFRVTSTGNSAVADLYEGHANEIVDSGHVMPERGWENGYAETFSSRVRR